MNYYSLSVKLKAPTPEEQNTSFTDLQSDIEEAVAEFNKYFYGKKGLILGETASDHLNLILVLFKDTKEKVTAKALTWFSRYLYHEKNWARFSREEGKLFILASPISISSASIWNDKVDRNDYYWLAHGYNIQSDEEEEEQALKEYIPDEQVIPILNYLLATQHSGTKEQLNRKLDAITRIKNILYHFV